jgi:hypothetical protein
MVPADMGTPAQWQCARTVGAAAARRRRGGDAAATRRRRGVSPEFEGALLPEPKPEFGGAERPEPKPEFGAERSRLRGDGHVSCRTTCMALHGIFMY